MALRNVMDYRTDDILRKKSKKVEKIDDKIVALLDDMAETMYHAKGIGLAAPQIGVLKRMIVIDIGEGIIKLINPEIVEMSGEQQEIEGCLSVPGVYGEVNRPQKVLVRALDQKGDEVNLDGTGLLHVYFVTRSIIWRELCLLTK